MEDFIVVFLKQVFDTQNDGVLPWTLTSGFWIIYWMLRKLVGVLCKPPPSPISSFPGAEDSKSMTIKTWPWDAGNTASKPSKSPVRKYLQETIRFLTKQLPTIPGDSLLGSPCHVSQLFVTIFLTMLWVFIFLWNSLIKITNSHVWLFLF